MKKFTLSLLLAFPFLVNAQYLRGTFFIVASCKNGIVLGVDSRASIAYDKNGKPHDVAYYDRFQKAFIIKDFAAIFSNQTSFNWLTISHYVQQFQKSIPEKGNIPERIKQWEDYARKNLGGGALKISVLFAKYEQGQPQIGILDGPNRGFTGPQAFVTNDRTYDFRPTRYWERNTKEVAQMIEQSIYSYAKQKNKTKTVGGPIAVINITPLNSITWLSTFKFLKIDSSLDAMVNPNKYGIEVHYNSEAADRKSVV